jgi:hypothetical protein
MPLASSGHKLVVRECSLVSDTAPGRVTWSSSLISASIQN